MSAPGAGPRVLVLTVVHHPEDARIRYRQIPAMLAAGFAVTYAAPFTGYGVARPPGMATLDVPRAIGRHRMAALRAARAVLAGARSRVDLVLLHDPELLLALGLDRWPAPGPAVDRWPAPGPAVDRWPAPGPARGPAVDRWPAPGPAVAWDVHEDTAAAVALRSWIPALLRRPAVAGVRVAELLAERRVHLLLAEYDYAARFARPHPVVPNTTTVPVQVPPPAGDRVVHLGHLTAARGAPELLLAAREIRRRTGGTVTTHLLGPADAATEPAVRAAVAAGDVVWHGFVPNDVAVREIEGAAAGLVLMRDNAHHRSKLPTKAMEYLAHGVPTVAAELPALTRLLTQSGGGVTVPAGPPERVGQAAAAAVLALLGDPDLRSATATAGHRWAAGHLDWAVHAAQFTDVLARWAGTDRAGAGPDQMGADTDQVGAATGQLGTV